VDGEPMFDIFVVLVIPGLIAMYHFSTYSRRGRRWGQL